MEGPIELIFGLCAQNRFMYEVTEGNLEKKNKRYFFDPKTDIFPKCLFYDQKFYQNVLCGT